MKYNATTHSYLTNTTEKISAVTVGPIPFVPPVASFTASPGTGTAPLEVKFTDQSTGNPGSYVYDFGDGVKTTGKDPVHTYRIPGTYTVTLTVTKYDPAHVTVIMNTSVQAGLIVVT